MSGKARERTSSPDLPCEGLSLAILLVEDDPMNQAIVRTILSADGQRVTVAAHGGEALALAAHASYDLVLMDLQMPGMDGLTATTALRALPDHATTPIVAMTANACEDDRARCLAAGMDDVLAKPFQPDALRSIVGRWGRGGGVAAAPTSAPPSPACAIPVMTGLDTEPALARVAQDRALYVRLLRAFVETRADTAVHISDALAAGEPDAARRMAHTIKGVAGNLGITRAHASAARLEACLASAAPAEISAAALQEFGAVMSDIVNRLRQALPSLPPPPSPPAPGQSKPPGELVEELLRRLRGSDFSALRLFEANRLVFAAACDPEQFARLEQEINTLNFPEACALIESHRW